MTNDNFIYLFNGVINKILQKNMIHAKNQVKKNHKYNIGIEC
jgi:hypothetical protein